MFPRKLDDHNGRSALIVDEYEMSDCGYGKDNVKILHVHREGNIHTIKEFEVNTHLKLSTKKDYTHGDNSDIVATDSQKNTVYLLAKKFGIKSPEEFALRLSNHFLTKYNHVQEVHIYVEEYPWERIKYAHHQHHGKGHNHAFVFAPIATRYCDVMQNRMESQPTVISGLKNMRVLKTTKSSFVNFVNDEFRSLPDAEDRLFSTIVSGCWQYKNYANLDFDRAWNDVKEIILQTFAGDLEHGIPSPSVQNTIYVAQKEVLKKIKEIDVINIEMPNKHYFAFDVSKHPKVVDGVNKDVFHPVDKPSGIIFAQLRRKNVASKL